MTANELHAKLAALAEKVTPGEWTYRPEPEYDDWGILRMAPDAEGWRPVILQARDPRYLDEECLAEHRRAKTDPWRDNAEFIALCFTHKATILQSLAELGALREALERIECLGSDGEHSGDRHARCRTIARQALGDAA